MKGNKNIISFQIVSDFSLIIYLLDFGEKCRYRMSCGLISQVCREEGTGIEILLLNCAIEPCLFITSFLNLKRYN